MPTQQIPILATTTATTVAPRNENRRFMYLKNYVNKPTDQTAQANTIYIAFGVPATPGLNGEYELLPGSEYVWNGVLPPLLGDLPFDYISVCTFTGTAYGAIMVLD